MDPYHLEKRNVAILVVSQTLFMVAAITVMTLSGVGGQQLSPEPGLATLPIAVMMLGTVVSTLPASLFMKRVGRRRGFMTGALMGGAAGGLLSFTAIGVIGSVQAVIVVGGEIPTGYIGDRIGRHPVDDRSLGMHWSGAPRNK